MVLRVRRARVLLSESRASVNLVLHVWKGWFGMCVSQSQPTLAFSVGAEKCLSCQGRQSRADERVGTVGGTPSVVWDGRRGQKQFRFVQSNAMSHSPLHHSNPPCVVENHVFSRRSLVLGLSRWLRKRHVCGCWVCRRWWSVGHAALAEMSQGLV